MDIQDFIPIRVEISEDAPLWKQVAGMLVIYAQFFGIVFLLVLVIHYAWRI